MNRLPLLAATALLSIAAGPVMDDKIALTIKGMTTEQKVAQLIMPDIASITPDDVRTYRFGTILNGGNSGPGGDERAAPAAWLGLADRYWDAAMAPRGDGTPVIPLLWATDALHGHNNVVGATLFPHNINLGATRNPALVSRIGTATAREIAATGLDWTFAPTLAVATDARWGRTYESYSADPKLVARLGTAMVAGLQGSGPIAPDRVLATAKHYLGDGGTGGKDQGETSGSDGAIKRLHGAGYPPAIKAGVGTVMASFSSLNGVKMHGNAPWLTGHLRGELGFSGLVVGDWNGHGQVPGCTVSHCPAAINAGLDIFMVPEDWRALYASTIADVRAGTIPMARLDEAVGRVLAVKAFYGAADRGRPSMRPMARTPGIIGHADHRALARDAVRQSLVLLKNNGGLLPLRPRQNVLVVGAAADCIARQSGGWTISWQGGGDLTNADFPGAQSIHAGIAAAVTAAGGTATLSADGGYQTRPDVAIMVFGERPYAEFMGDAETLEYSPADKSDLATLRRLRAAGIPVVSIFLSGRPLWVNAEINASDAFVAAFLPGSEGGGVADLLFTRPDGRRAHDFTGRLPFAWPAAPLPVAGRFRAQFPIGHGLSLARATRLAPLSETRPVVAGQSGALTLLGGNGLPAAWTMVLADSGGRAGISSDTGQSPGGAVRVRGIDRNRQEDARLFTFTAAGDIAINAAGPIDLARAQADGAALVIDFKRLSDIGGPITLGLTGPGGPASIAIDKALTATLMGEWQQVAVPLTCLATAGLTAVTRPFTLTTAAPVTIALSGIRIAPATGTRISC